MRPIYPIVGLVATQRDSNFSSWTLIGTWLESARSCQTLDQNASSILRLRAWWVKAGCLQRIGIKPMWLPRLRCMISSGECRLSSDIFIFLLPRCMATPRAGLASTSSLHRSSPYAVSRAACDLHLLSFFKAYGFPAIFTRAANVYGAGQQLYRIIPRALMAALTGTKLDLHGGGHSQRCFIHIDDVCTGTEQIALNGVPGEAYHLSTTEPISIRVSRTRCQDL